MWWRVRVFLSPCAFKAQVRRVWCLHDRPICLYLAACSVLRNVWVIFFLAFTYVKDLHARPVLHDSVTDVCSVPSGWDGAVEVDPEVGPSGFVAFPSVSYVKSQGFTVVFISRIERVLWHA